ncbi:MAG TPA: thioredoxin [Longimicrobiales bacterium]
MATVPCTFCGALNQLDLARIAQRPKCGKCSRLILLDRPVKLGDSQFDRVIADAQVPVLVDFYADWCAPCQAMAPAIDEFAHEHPGQVLVGKLDTDRNPEISARFNIRGIPTLIVFNQGRELRRQTGALGRAQLERFVDLGSNRAAG